MTRAIALFSGGLDSVLASKIVMDEGIDVLGIHFITEFLSKDIGEFKKKIVENAREINLNVEIIDITPEFLEMMKNPRYGFGSNINPCIDCKILMLIKAKEMMRNRNAQFLVTGEVLGERPMSQRKDAFNAIEKRSGLKGLILRPLSAKLLPETIAEANGLIDRERLFDIQGRSRAPQLTLAKNFGIKKHFTPAGGCLLTDPNFSKRLKDAMARGYPDIGTIKLLKAGRHFKIADKTRLVIGRDEADNKIVSSLIKEGDVIIEPAGFAGPVGLLRGEISKEIVDRAASLYASHTKFKDKTEVAVNIGTLAARRSSKKTVKPAARSEVEILRI